MNAVPDRARVATFLDDDRIELETTVDIEDLVAVLEAEQPLPLAPVQEKPTQIACAVVGIETRWDDETKTTRAGYLPRPPAQ